MLFDKFRRTAARRARAGILALGAAVGAAAPAAADVTFRFTQTGPSAPGGWLTAFGFLSLSDAAFRNGVDISLDRTDGPLGAAPDWASLGVTGLSFTVEYSLAPWATLSATLADLVYDSRPFDVYDWSLDLSSQPRGRITGTFSYQNFTEPGMIMAGSDFDFFFDGPRSFGTFNTDYTTDPLPNGQATCGWTGTCSFQGVVHPSAVRPVPEPASLALFGTALAGLGLARRRRRPVPGAV